MTGPGRSTGCAPCSPGSSPLKRELDLTWAGPLVLLTGYQAPAATRRMGPARLEAWLRARHILGAAKLAETTCRAAARQRTMLPGEGLTASLTGDLAREVITLGERIRDTDKLIEDRSAATATPA